MKPDAKINNIPVPTKTEDWRTKGFDARLSRTSQSQPGKPGFLAGVNFDALLDEMVFNRMLRLKNLPTTPQGNEPGKIYWDQVNNKYKLWINSTVGFVDVQYTSTSTSTTSSSSSSSSTSSTSSSSSSTSTTTT